MTVSDRVMIFDVDGDRAARIAASVESLGLKPILCDRPEQAAEALRRERPALALVAEIGPATPEGPGPFRGVRELARSFGLPSLAVVEPGADPSALVDRVRPYDAWLAQAEIARELPARLASLLAIGPGRQAPTIDPRFLALVVHDVRTPLNVIGLTIRAIGQSFPVKSPELEEDLHFLQENANQIERMLAQLGDYCRLLESESPPSGLEFQPQRFLADILEERQSRPGSEAKPVRLEIGDGSPHEVALDPTRVRTALLHAIANAVNASGDAPVRLRSRGRGGRWIVEVVVDKAPPPTVTPTALRPGLFERLTGSAAERRGLDLAIAARISESFGGSARLEVEPGQRSTVVLDWPERLGQP